MKKHKFKKILWTTMSVITLLAAVLVVHIYMVTRTKAPDINTRIMARLDFNQPLQKEDANKITAWLYNQKGVDRVLCNAQSGIAVFTFSPLQTGADKIVSGIRSNLYYKVDRYMPSKEELQSGCPVGAGSGSSKVYSAITNFFN
jgi:hypothetical protein